MKKPEEITTQDRKKKIPTIQVGASSVIGARSSQQDSLLNLYRHPFHLGVICDGMGGMEGGELASQTATGILAADFIKLSPRENISEFLSKEAFQMNKAVSELRNKKGEPINAGTTLVAVIINQDRLYWISAGDSRIYHFRDGEMVQLTRDHNYGLTLDILLRRGVLSTDEYMEESAKSEALISYLGVEDLRLVDSNAEPIILRRDDMLLLCSDGLYKTLGNGKILNLMYRYQSAQETAGKLTSCAMEMGGRHQDNTSVIVYRYT